MHRSGLLSLTLSSSPLSNSSTQELSLTTCKRGRVLSHEYCDLTWSIPKIFRKMGWIEEEKLIIWMEMWILPSTPFFYWTTSINLLLALKSSPRLLKAPKGREIYTRDTRTTMDGGNFVPGAPVCGNTGHRSPRKLPQSDPLLREQLVCSCSSRTCISPSGFLFLFSIPTVVLRDLTIPRKLSQAPRK